MKTKKKRSEALVVVSLVDVAFHIQPDTVISGEVPIEKFEYEIDDGHAIASGKEWIVIVKRDVEAFYEAQLKYRIELVWQGKGEHSDDEYDKPKETAISMIADRASYLLSAITFDAFMTPFITPPFFRNPKSED